MLPVGALAALPSLSLGASIALATPPSSRAKEPAVRYRLAVAAGDTTGFDVEMRVRSHPDTFRIAMVRHPEYDDRFWRFVEGLRVETPAGPGTVTREDSALWRVVAPPGEATLRWRVRVPPSPSPRAAWRPFLAPTGALVGGPHSFPYVVGRERAPVEVTLALPAAWRVATALSPAGADAPGVYRAPDVHTLVESPILAGALREWRFTVREVPHRIVYWPRPDAAPFDTTAFVDGVRRLTEQAVALFGGMPYREFTFLFQDGAYGALEHPASVTLGAPSEALARDPQGVIEETAHEFLHTWNLMAIRPAEYGEPTWKPIAPAPTLWFGEGLTIFYSDLLRRRAGLHVDEPTRREHLRALLARYLDNPAHGRYSPEAISRAEYPGGPGALGDYTASAHQVGELLGNALDLTIRDATDGGRSMDDVMRLLYARFGDGRRGIGTADVERAVRDVCGCDVAPFFDRHVRAATPLDPDRLLAPAALRARVAREPVRRDGTPEPDLRLRAWVPSPDSGLRLMLLTPESAWGRAGLHTGDRVLAVNGAPTASWPELRTAILRLRVGDPVRVELAGGPGPRAVTFPMTGWERTVVTLEERAESSERERRVRAAWEAGTP